MVTKSDRHAMVEVSCVWCGGLFTARRERVEKGQSRFCSKEHYREWLKENTDISNVGKENARVYFKESQGIYCVVWFDSETKKYKFSTWLKWAWEINFGEVPKGHRLFFKDGNSLNITVENVGLRKSKKPVSQRRHPTHEEWRKNLSIAHKGKILSEEHRKNIALSMEKKWANGLFDGVHKGKNNWHWRGGVEKPYPREFEKIKDYIRERDKYMCQICGKHLHKKRDSHIHHIDGNKKHNNEENLILLCIICHGKIHAKSPAPPSILAFRSMLEWNVIENNLPNPLNFPEEQ